MPLECCAPSVSNQGIRVNIVIIGRIKTNETTEDHINRIRGRKDKTNMDMVTIEVRHLDKTFRMKVRRSIIIHVIGATLKVSVGRMVKIMVVTTAEAVTPQRNVGNRIAVAMGRTLNILLERICTR